MVSDAGQKTEADRTTAPCRAARIRESRVIETRWMGNSCPRQRTSPGYDWRRFPDTMTETLARVRIELLDLEPKVWRRVDVPLSSTLFTLHDIIQCMMGWKDYHLFQFEIADRCYVHPEVVDEFDCKVYKASSLRLKTLVDRGIQQLRYLYDFGDHWMHNVSIEEIHQGRPDVDYPSFVDGARRCPPEDCGGLEGFLGFLEATLDPSHQQHEETKVWYESFYGSPFDLEEFDERRVRMDVNLIARGRRGPLLSHRGAARRRRDAAAAASKEENEGTATAD